MPGHATPFQTSHLIFKTACEIGSFTAISINDDPKTEQGYGNCLRLDLNSSSQTARALLAGP